MFITSKNVFLKRIDYILYSDNTLGFFLFARSLIHVNINVMNA